MAIVSKTVLKGYFENAKVPGYLQYVDFIDTMGDMNRSVYDTNEDGRVNLAVDADTVDGEHATAFAPSGYGLGVVAQLATGDWNNYITTGFYRGNALSNAPTASQYYVVVIAHSATYVTQEATYYFTLNSPQKYIRRMVNGSWDTWQKIHPAQWTLIEGKPSTYTPSAHTHAGGDITSAVANATAAVNSDTVDSLHAASFIRSDADDTKTGDLRMSGGLVLGSTLDYAANGQLVRTGNHYRRIGDVNYDVNGMHDPGTITVWSNQTKVTNTTTSVDTSAYGIPANVAFVLIRHYGLGVTLNGAVTFQPKSSGRQCKIQRIPSANYYLDDTFWCPCDANGDFDFITVNSQINTSYLFIHGWAW